MESFQCTHVSSQWRIMEFVQQLALKVACGVNPNFTFEKNQALRNDVVLMS